MLGYEGWSQIGIGTNAGENNYNSLQVQINKRFGKRLQYGLNYTWAKELGYNRTQDLPDILTYAEANSVHPQVVNANFGYKLQNGTGLLPGGWKNYGTKLVLDGWNLNGVIEASDGTPLTVSCAISGAPIGYYTGTPVDAPSTRCQMNGNLWLPAGATPASVGSTSSQRLWFPLNAGPTVNNSVAGFQLPATNSLGIGNLPPTLFLGPGLFNADLSLFKEITLGKETRVLQFRVEAFNALNHFNPGNPNTNLTYNYPGSGLSTAGAETNASFGQVTSAQNTARHVALSLRLRF
jgi:hypothetical protein